jgi:hypothetical protein
VKLHRVTASALKTTYISAGEAETGNRNSLDGSELARQNGFETGWRALVRFGKPRHLQQ